MLYKGIFCFLFCVFCTAAFYPSANRDLILAVSKGNLKDVQTLVAKGADVNYKYDKGKTPLFWAVVAGNLKIAIFLISKGADVNAKDDNMVTPLHMSAIKRNLDLTKYLILKGADVNAVDKYGWTPLHYFSYYENALGLMYLIMQEADLNALTEKEYMDVPTNSSALDIAQKKNFSNIIVALENPDKYIMLGKKPYLAVTVTNEIGNNGVLIAPEKGTILITVENKGGLTASNVSVIIESLSNTEGLNFGSFSNFNINSGQRTEFRVAVEAAKNIKGGTAFFKIYAMETNYSRKSVDWILSFPTLPPQPPKLLMTAEWITSNSNVLNALEKAWLKLAVTNAGIGYAEPFNISYMPLAGASEIKTGTLSGLYLKPYEATNLMMNLEAGENLTDGVVEFNLIAEEPQFSNTFTNYMAIKTRHLPKPYFEIRTVFNTYIQNKTITNIQSELVSKEPETGTNYYEEISTNIIEFSITNYKPVLVLKNSGEGPAYNTKMVLKFLETDLGDIAQYSPVDLTQGINYQIPLIQTNEEKMLELPITIPDYYDHFKLTWNAAGSDEKNWCKVNTNITYYLKNNAEE